VFIIKDLLLSQINIQISDRSSRKKKIWFFSTLTSTENLENEAIIKGTFGGTFQREFKLTCLI
jgi:hypothetical protein